MQAIDWEDRDLLEEIAELKLDTAQLQFALEQSEKVVNELAVLVNRLARSLRKESPDNEILAKAMDYLKRNGLEGSPLRDV